MSKRREIEVSVVIPVTHRYHEVTKLYRDYKAGLETTGRGVEFIFVLDSSLPQAREELEKLKAEGEPLKLVVLGKSYGESTAMAAGASSASGDVIMTLPAFRQVAPEEIGRVLEALSDDVDMVVARRYPRRDPLHNRIASKIFHGLLRTTFDFSLEDLGCNVRVFRRGILDELQIQGDMRIFLPLLAHEQGFKVIECCAAQASSDALGRIYSPAVYLRSLLDILTFIFLVRFTKRPLRFFGVVGAMVFSLGGIATLWLVFERLFLDVALADRPALFLASLMIVLGIQMLAVGLIGELIIFTHAKDIKEYNIAEIVE
jgi:glycosyltransferase involved in cell wall biosynthesis